MKTRLLRITSLIIIAFLMIFISGCDSREVTISFSVNGGSQITSIDIEQGSTLTDLPEATRTGYDFAGWYYDAALTDPVSSTLAIQRNITIYADWTVQSYQVTFMDGDETLRSFETNYGDIIDFSNEPTKVGYQFVGWYVDEELFDTDDKISSDTIFTAYYEIDEYVIIFDLGNGTTQSKIINYGDEIGDLPSSVLTPQAGKEIVWKVYNDETLGDIADFTDITSDMTYKSVYEDIYLNVVIDDDLGNETPLSIKYNDLIVRPSNDPVKEHYNFTGWVDEDGLQYDFSTPVIEEITITATYSIQQFQVSFYDEDGQIIGTPQMIDYESSAVAPTYTAPDGYNFVEWDDDFSSVTENMQINVVLQGLSYNLIFDTNDGSTIDPLSALIDEDLTRPDNPTKSGYTFSGWFLDEELTNEYVLFSTMPFEGFTLYAKWTENQYTLTLDPQLGNVSQPTVQVTFDNEIGSLPSPTRLGYDFLGWSFDSNETEGDYLTVSTTYTTADDSIAYAIWAPTTYTITLFVNGGDALDDNTIDVVYLSDVTTIPTPVREGYTFMKWNTQSNGLGTDFTNGTQYELTSNLSLYAIWEANSYSLAYTVEYYFENAEDDLFSLGESISHSGSTDEIVNAIINTYTGFVFDSESANNVLTGTVTSDGNLVLKVYYNRLTYTVTTVDSADIANGTFTVKYNGLLTELPNPSREGYTFLGWIDGDNDDYIASDTINNDLTLYARWQQLTYTVTIERILLRGETQVSSSTFTVTIAHGTMYSPISLLEGYSFTEFVDKDDQTYTSDLDSIEITESQTITVYYSKLSYSISFTQFLTTAEDTTTEFFTVYYDETFTSVPSLILDGNPAYSLVIWNRGVFQHVKSNIDVYAIYYPAGGTTVTFMDDGAIKYLVTMTPEIASGQFITNSSAIWNLQKDGYAFLGWFYDEAGTLPVLIENMDFTYIPSSITVYAMWEELSIFTEPTDISVTVDSSVVSVSWTQEPIEAAYPTEFILLVDGIEHTITASEFTQIGNVFASSEVYLDVLKVPGIHHVAVLAMGDNLDTKSSNYSEVLEYVVETEEEEISEVATYDYFLIETTVSGVTNYIFYTDMTYNFSSKYTFIVLDGNEYISANGNQLITTGTPGSFVIMMNKTENDVTTQTIIQGKVVTYINQFQLGNSINDYLNEQEESNYLSTTFEPYKVGYLNDFYFDLNILDNTGTKVDVSETTLNFRFYLKSGSNYVLLEDLDLADYVEQKSGYLFEFTEEAVGETFKVEIEPRYQANAMTVPMKSFEFVVIEAHNAFNNEQLQDLYGDMSVHHVVLHSDIIAEVDSRYLNDDGTPMNGYGQVLPNGTIDLRGNVYQRVAVADDDSLIIDGNYFTIDGSDLPYLKTTSDPDGNYTDVGVGTGGSYGIVSVQVGMFLYNVTPDPTGVIINNDNEVSYKNLTVIGNTTTPNVNYSLSAEEILEQEILMSRNSGGFTGIMTRNGNTVLDNVNIGYTTIAMFMTAYGYQTDGVTSIGVTANNLRTYEAWANSFYNYGSPLIDISNSSIGKSGGAAIHIEDVRPGNSGIEDITVLIDEATEVNNWVSGDEAWFKAYGFSSIALALKSSGESAVNDFDKSIIRLEENQITGAYSEKINFVLLSRDMTSAETFDASYNQTSGSEDVITFGDSTGATTIERDFDFLSTDFRSQYVSPGTLLFAVSAYSDSTVFMNSVMQATADFMTMGLPMEQAQEYAVQAIYIAGSYNLTVTQAENVIGFIGTYGGTVRDAVLAVTAGNLPEQPKYLEIAQSAPGLGKVQLFLELFDKVVTP